MKRIDKEGSKLKEEEIKKAVREGYGQIAQQGGSCCGPKTPCCAGPESGVTILKDIGYGPDDLQMAPEGSNLGLGCGNPVALASLCAGDIVLDLGSGGGFDCFLAAEKVGKAGRVFGVDMTPEMIDRARENARRGNYSNVEFRLGEIENLPAADQSIDVIISNCVINLSIDKPRVFREAFRVLKPGGRLMVSDIAWRKEPPDEIRQSINAHISCVGGAIVKDSYVEAIRAAGFEDVQILSEKGVPMELLANDPTAKAIAQSLHLTEQTAKEIAGSIVSISILAIKPPITSQRPFPSQSPTRLGPELASPRDEVPIKYLLADCGLPWQDISEAHLKHFWVIREGAQIAGVIGLELVERHALLRSLAVLPGYRNRGLGSRLAGKAEEYASSLGVDTVFLLTLTAAEFFSKRGYQKTERQAAPLEMQDLSEFQNLCPASAVCMAKKMG